jgi:hypothetical protein
MLLRVSRLTVTVGVEGAGIYNCGGGAAQGRT